MARGEEQHATYVMPRLSYILTYPCPATLFPIAGSEVTFHASPQAIPANSTPTGQEFRIWYQSSACASPTLLACTNTLHGRCNHQWQWNKAVEQAKTTTDNHANKLLSQRLN